MLDSSIYYLNKSCLAVDQQASDSPETGRQIESHDLR